LFILTPASVVKQIPWLIYLNVIKKKRLANELVVPLGAGLPAHRTISHTTEGIHVLACRGQGMAED